jgi:hypothetical protein
MKSNLSKPLVAAALLSICAPAFAQSPEDTLVLISELMAGMFALFALAVVVAVAITHTDDEMPSKSHG